MSGCVISNLCLMNEHSLSTSSSVGEVILTVHSLVALVKTQLNKQMYGVVVIVPGDIQIIFIVLPQPT